MATTSSLGDELNAIILARLRTRYPYMKIGAVNNIAEQLGRTLNEEIQAQEPVMEATKAKVSFMSLSAELRNRIYELALIPQAKGDGGIDWRTAIYADTHTGTDFDCTIERNRKRGEDCSHCWHDIRATSALSKPPALLRTSRQVRQEALPIYYGGNTFVAWRDSEHMLYFEEGDEFAGA
ncbi:hypothetical protein LTR85_008965 [Meristemomyces frigidus]|nr:hypothetical protein LTR85_008965 [Meristemomyces frigidus]